MARPTRAAGVLVFRKKRRQREAHQENPPATRAEGKRVYSDSDRLLLS